jgi:hypothetical protein
MQTTQGSLVMVGLNTTTPQVFWNGVMLQGITGIQVDNDAEDHKVVLKMREDTTVSELRAAGIAVRRV